MTLKEHLEYRHIKFDVHKPILSDPLVTLNVPCVFITEGVFDAARLTKRGCCAFAMLTNNPSTSMRNFLMCLGKPIIAVCDNDPSGIKLRKAGHCFETVPAKDLGDAPEEYIDFLIGKYHEI